MFDVSHLSYQETGSFSQLVNDYLGGHPGLSGFYGHPVNIQGVKKALEEKRGKTDRRTLAEVLVEQYRTLSPSASVAENIQSLLSENSFTVCTAHQPNLATGPLYVIYKILHVIRLAAELKKQFPENHFVPVFYMGSEDADKEEINHFNIHGKKYEWQTAQAGAVGRMKVDKGLRALFAELSQQLKVWPHGEEWTGLLLDAYTEGESIQRATLKLLDRLFGKYGLVILIADHPALKQKMHAIFWDDLSTHTPSKLVASTCEALGKNYPIQANPREINLFYLSEGTRERIEKKGSRYEVCNTDISFSEDEMKKELKDHPDRFSPNVILRGIFQETILPNIIFVGGGGEVAYWLQLKALFDQYKVAFPLLVLRNSFMIVEPHQQELIEKLGLEEKVLFQNEVSIVNWLLEKEGRKPQLNGEFKELEKIYDQLQELASSSDPTLAEHVSALRKKSIDKIRQLEQKMLRAERKKQEAGGRQIKRLKSELFPGGLQERKENIGSFFSKYGEAVIDSILKNSPALEQQFTILRIPS